MTAQRGRGPGQKGSGYGFPTGHDANAIIVPRPRHTYPRTRPHARTHGSPHTHRHLLITPSSLTRHPLSRLSIYLYLHSSEKRKQQRASLLLWAKAHRDAGRKKRKNANKYPCPCLPSAACPATAASRTSAPSSTSAYSNPPACVLAAEDPPPPQLQRLGSRPHPRPRPSLRPRGTRTTGDR